MATGGYFGRMTVVSIKDAKNRFSELGRRAEQGETVIVTRNGKPAFDLVPHRTEGGLDLEAGGEFLRQHGVKQLFSRVADDFDEPLPEDFLLKPL
jgi:prevent-host-death family protein